MSFEEGMKKVVECVADIAELNVRTYTGTIKAELRGQPLKEIMKTALADGSLEIVGITDVGLDGDVDQYISNSDTVSDELRESHFKAVESGKESRKATIEFFGKAITETFDTLKAG